MRKPLAKQIIAFRVVNRYCLLHTGERSSAFVQKLKRAIDGLTKIVNNSTMNRNNREIRESDRHIE
jgi:hypothetical protein